MSATELTDLDATAQADLVRAKEVSPLELVDAAVARAEVTNPMLNAIIHERYERARAEAAADALPDGPFRGVPIVIKDLDGTVAGEPYHAGTKFLRGHGYVAPADTEHVRRFRAAGFVIIGKTNTPELGLQTTTESEAYGPCHNPWNLDHSTGGSSGGSGAAVAAGIVPVGHAGDGGGSIRIPASMCGLVGLKPTRGRTTMGPALGESWAGAVVRHVVSRTVRDSAAILDATAGPMAGDPYTAPPPLRPWLDEVGRSPGSLRIAVTTDVPNQSVTVDPEVAAVVGQAATMLESLGHHTESAKPDWDNPDFTATFIDALTVWVARDLDVMGEMVGEPVTEAGVEVGTWMLAELGRAVSATRYHEAIDAIHAQARRIAALWWPADGSTGFDLLLTPVVPELPPPLGSYAATPDNPLHGLLRAAEATPFTAPFNATGQPGISVPSGWSASGLPIGVQLVAAAGREDLLIAVAAQLEQAVPWSDRRP